MIRRFISPSPRRLYARFAILVLLAAAYLQTADSAVAADFDAAKERFAAAAAAELERGILPGFSVAWIVDGEVVHASGYGMADWKQGVPATADTLYRAGSISKLFNAIAAMQLVEQGKLDLDAPIQKALPSFSIVVPFADAKPITIRQLLCHRSGMIRESPVGGYLDPSQPTIDATLASVAGCVLVNPSDTKTRYSNVGPTIVGKAVEKHSGLAYPAYQQKHVLGPLGMSGSAWLMNDELRPRLAKGRMRIARGDGEYDFDVAPEFELGTLPAGNLYTSAGDLAKFAIFMLGGDPSSELVPPLVHPASLEMMYTPQLIDDAAGFGLGFYVGSYRDRKSVQHSGAVYGFTTMLIVLPDERIGALVLSNCDIGMAPVRRLTDLSLDLLLEKAHGVPPTEPTKTITPDSEELAAIAGEYESRSYWAKLEARDGKLTAVLSGQPLELSAAEPLKYLADGRIMSRAPFDFEREKDGSIRSFTAAGQKFTRVDPDRAAPAPAAWQALVGTYGPKFIPLVVSVRNGHLYATIENEYDYRLTPVDRVTFALPPGMYSDEQVVFQLGTDGKPSAAIMANQTLPRRAD